MTALADAGVAGEFPSLQRDGIVYLDAAATSQTPRQVLSAMEEYYEHHRATVHRGLYPLAVEATDLFEGARDRIAAFVGGTPRETIFTRNATEAINLVAYSWGRANVRAGDRVLVSEMEHHSNLVPWFQLAREVGATLDVVPIDDQGRLDMDALVAKLRHDPAHPAKLLAVTHVSNVLGTINPVAEIARLAREQGVVTMVDGSQAVPQMAVDLREIDADFYAWTGHKAYGPTGVGVLHGRRELLDAMPPFMSGGHMIASVSFGEVRFAEVPGRFEAGTSNIAEAIGLGAAVDFLSELGMDTVRAHEQRLTAYALERLTESPGVRVNGPPEAEDRGGIVSFTLDVAHPHDVAEILGREGICVRAGHHCTQPLMKRLGVGATTRASFAIHSTRSEVDALVDGLDRVREVFA